MRLAAGQLAIGESIGYGLSHFVQQTNERVSGTNFCVHPDVLVLPELLNLATFDKQVQGFVPSAFGDQNWWRSVGDWLCRHVHLGWLRKTLLTVETYSEYQRIMKAFSTLLPCTYIVGGSVIVPLEDDYCMGTGPTPTRIINVGNVFLNGQVMSKYTKKHVTEIEVALGVEPGAGPSCIHLGDGRRLFNVICWDVDFVDDWGIPEKPFRDDVIAVSSWGWRPYDAWQEDSEDANYIRVARKHEVNMVRTFWAGDLLFGRYAGRSAIIDQTGRIVRAPLSERSMLCLDV